MSYSNDTIYKAQVDVGARLAASEYFVDIPVIIVDKGNILTQVQQALGTIAGKNGKTGVCALVLQPVGTVANPEIPAPIMDLDIVVRVLENVVVNRSSNGTGKTAGSIARAIVDILHLYNCPGIIDAMIPQNPTIIPVAPNEKVGDPSSQIA